MACDYPPGGIAPVRIGYDSDVGNGG